VFLWSELTVVGQEGHQYIEIGYYFAHLMLHAQALKLLDDGKQTPIESGSPASAARTPSDMPASTYDAKKTHMSAISQLSTQILSRARRVEVAEIRVPLLPFPPERGFNVCKLIVLACYRYHLLHHCFCRRQFMQITPLHPNLWKY
jgi:hypothetical protein